MSHDDEDIDSPVPDTEPLPPEEWMDRIEEAATALKEVAERCPFCVGAEAMCPRCAFLAVQADGLMQYAKGIQESLTPPIRMVPPSDN